MTSCVCLGDSAVRDILINLSREDVIAFQRKQEEALRLFSVGEERSYQPDPGVVVRPNGQKALFRPFTSSSSVGTKIIVTPAPETVTTADGKTEERRQPLHGILVLCDQNGIPSGIINAAEVTGFRTSLSAIIPWTWRRHTESIVVFGAGKQALWHTRLALMLRGEEIKSITIVNRSHARAKGLVEQITSENESRWNSKAAIISLDPESASYGQDLKEILGKTDVVFCTVPSQEVLFPEADLKLRSEGRQPPYISAIGSWRPEMIELDPKLLQSLAGDESAFNPNGSSNGGVVVVDDAKSTLEDSGELINSGLKSEQLIEIGTVLDKRQRDTDSGQKSRFEEWLASDLVVYKSIGIGLTDLIAGEAILEMARKRNLGTAVSDL